MFYFTHFCSPWNKESSFSCFSFLYSLWTHLPSTLPEINMRFELPFQRFFFQGCSWVFLQNVLLRGSNSMLISSSSLLHPSFYVLCVWSIALVTYFSLALWSKAFIVSPLFLNSCAYLCWFCEWCKYLSKKSLCWAANYPLIFSALQVRRNHLTSNKKLAKSGNESKEHCSCSSAYHTEKNIVLLSNTAHPCCSCNRHVYNLV